jgi:pyruvate formate lyase activating enzyme
VIFIQVNFGGFVPLSTVDWRGRSVCTVFLRGCPLKCSYCQNDLIQNGQDFLEIQVILDMIRSSEPYISGVVFSGGEPTMQKEALVALCGHVKKMNLGTGIQTNGLFPETLSELIGKKTVDKVAIDYKTRWEQYSDHWEGFQNIKKENYQKSVRESIKICKKAYNDKILPEFEVVVTVFHGNEKDIIDISKEIGNIDLIIQQGEHKLGFVYSPLHAISELEYLNHKKSIREDFLPLTDEEIKKFADNLKRPVRIRTRNTGEIFYEGHRGRRASRKR